MCVIHGVREQRVADCVNHESDAADSRCINKSLPYLLDSHCTNVAPRQHAQADMHLIDDAIVQSHIAERIIRTAQSPGMQISCNTSTLNDALLIPRNMLASSIRAPASLKEALNDPLYGQHWRQAARKEMASIRARRTYFLMALPKGRSAINCKWIFNVKAKADGRVEKFKARLVVKGFSQRPGVDYDETFAPVAHTDSQRVLLALSLKLRLKLRQADILNAFLCGDIDCEIFMKQPEGFIDDEHPEFVCKLEKGLYGLKQAGFLFNAKLDRFLVDVLRFVRCNADPCIYYRRHSHATVLLSIHVDDMLFAHNDDAQMEDIMQQLHSQFGIKDLGAPEKLLGIRVHQDATMNAICLDQQVYVEELLCRFNMEQCSEMPTPHQPGVYLSEEMCPTTIPEQSLMASIPYAELVGGLNYLATRTRPDISYIVSQLCRFMRNPGLAHWKAARRVLRYLKATKSWGVCYDNAQDIEAWTDSDWAGHPDQRRSVGGFVFQMCGGPLAWKSQRQKSTALSALEAEYMAQCLTARQAAWFHQLLSEIVDRPGPITINGDNQGCQSVAANRRTDSKTKHIEVQYHYTRDKIEDKTITLKYRPTSEMLADYLTKPISTVKFKWCRDAIGMVDVALRRRVGIKATSSQEG